MHEKKRPYDSCGNLSKIFHAVESDKISPWKSQLKNNEKVNEELKIK